MSKKSVASPLPEDDDGAKPRKQNVFKVWPEPQAEAAYGPSPLQRLLFTEELGEERPHYHPVDICLYIGGARSGKTVAAVARILSFALKNPGCLVVCGAVNYPILQRTLLSEIGKRFSHMVPFDMVGKAGSPILKKPTQVDKRIVLRNGSQILFLHLEDPAILRGLDADLIVFEEAALIEDEASFRELIRRLSGRKGPLRQLILLTNPTTGGSWLDEAFKLEQLRDTYTGEIETIIDPCNCHLCQQCISQRRFTAETAPAYVDGLCPECESKKQTECPGNEIWWRVIQTRSADNPHLHADYMQSMKSSMSEKEYQIFCEGSTENIRDGFVYKSFSDRNIIKTATCGIALDKPLILTCDFNYEPQSWVICQENFTSTGFHINVIDELIVWNALPMTAAEEFCAHPDVLAWLQATEGSQPVLVYGDPSGLYGTGGGLMPSYYQIIYNVLEKRGYDCRIMMRKPPDNNASHGSVLKEPVKIPVAGRVDALNEMLNKDGQMRLFINERCKNLIKSLRDLRYADDGINIDKACDKRAKRAVDKSRPFCMSHPTDALGYFVYKRFPVVKSKAGFAFWQVPGSPMIEITGKTFHERKLDETRLKKREDKLQARAERKAIRALAKTENSDSFGGYLRSLGLLH